jgi:phosphatidylglycerol:prolipoprotein diacylglycerol transferase
VHKIALQLGPLTVHWYGVLVAGGFVLGLWTAARRAPLAGLPGERVADLGPWLILGTILGARTLYVVSYWKESFASRPWWEVLAVHHGGLVFYGGLVGAAATVILYARVRRVPLWRLADVLAPSVALGHALGRVGCFVNGCCYGLPTALPWGFRYPESYGIGSAPVHPVQLYEAALNLGLYAGLAWWFRRRRFDGQVFAVYLVSYAVLRGVVEMFRGDYPVKYLGGVATPAHLVSAAVLAAGLGLYWKLSPRPAPKS